MRYDWICPNFLQTLPSTSISPKWLISLNIQYVTLNPHTNQSWHILLQLKQRARSLTPTGIRSLRSGAEILRDVHESTKALVKGEFSFPKRKLSLPAFFWWKWAVLHWLHLKLQELNKSTGHFYNLFMIIINPTWLTDFINFVRIVGG